MTIEIMYALAAAGMFFVGRWTLKRSATQAVETMHGMFKKSFEAYQQSVHHVLKDKGLDPLEIDRLAMEHHMRQTFDTLRTRLQEVATGSTSTEEK